MVKFIIKKQINVIVFVKNTFILIQKQIHVKINVKMKNFKI